MSTEVADADVRTRPRGRWQLLVLGLLAVATVVVLLDAGGWGAASPSTGGVGWTVGFLLWGVSALRRRGRRSRTADLRDA